MAKVILRPATKDDFRQLYPEKLNYNFYGVAAEVEGKVVGLTGVYYNRNWIAFARITDEAREYKVSIWRCALLLVDIMKRLDKPVFAVADPEIKDSDRLLLKLGFEYFGKDWYVWTP